MRDDNDAPCGPRSAQNDVGAGTHRGDAPGSPRSAPEHVGAGTHRGDARRSPGAKQRDVGSRAHLSRAAADLAARQHGVVAARQLRELGGERGTIASWVRSGRLHRLHRGVYALGHPVLPAGGAEVAALLAFGPGAWLSHSSAAGLWRLRPPAPALVELTRTGTSLRDRPGLRLHRARTVDGGDVTSHHGVAVTTPARTLLDLAETLPFRELERALDEAQIRNLVTPADLEALIDRSPGRRGVALLGALAGRSATTITRSELEERFLSLVRAARLPQPETNVRLEDCEVDFLWRAAQLVVETDGYAYHRTRSAFERDRRRDLRLQRAGYRVVRITHRALRDDAIGLVAELAALLA